MERNYVVFCFEVKLEKKLNSVVVPSDWPKYSQCQCRPFHFALFCCLVSFYLWSD